jgi:hypothetical protein
MTARYYARTASDRTDHWPIWFVADTQQGGLNVTAVLVRQHLNMNPAGLTLCRRAYAERLAILANGGAA